MIRHFVLNENAYDREKYPLGYFVCDFNVAGVYNKLAEARALANGDPQYLGYMSSAEYSAGFTEYTRAFNQAFLSLPAVPSTVLANASSHKEIVVREYKTEKHGTWYAVINIGLNNANDVAISLPSATGLKNAVNQAAVKSASGKVTVSLYPSQVLTWHKAP